METAELSEHGTRGLEMKGDQEMPWSRVFEKPTYLNINGSSRHKHIHGVIQSEPCIVNNSLSQIKVSIMFGGRIMSLLAAETFRLATFFIRADIITYLF